MIFALAFLLVQDDVFEKFLKAVETFEADAGFRKKLYAKVYTHGEFCRTSEYNAFLKNRYDAFIEKNSEDSMRVTVSKTVKNDDGTVRVEGIEIWKRRGQEVQTKAWCLLERVDDRWRVTEFHKEVKVEPFQNEVIYTAPSGEMKKDLSTPKAAAETCVDMLFREVTLLGDAKAAEMKSLLERLKPLCSPAFLEAYQKGFEAAVERGRKNLEALKIKIQSIEEKEGTAYVIGAEDRLILTKVKDEWRMSARQYRCASCKEGAKCEECKGVGWLDY